MCMEYFAHQLADSFAAYQVLQRFIPGLTIMRLRTRMADRTADQLLGLEV